jgi:hypothetical protein
MLCTLLDLAEYGCSVIYDASKIPTILFAIIYGKTILKWILKK